MLKWVGVGLSGSRAHRVENICFKQMTSLEHLHAALRSGFPPNELCRVDLKWNRRKSLEAAKVEVYTPTG